MTHVALVALFKLLKHHIKSQVVKHKVTWILIELAKHSQRRVVVSVYEGQIFDVQKRQDVRAIALIHGNPRISCGKEISESVRIFYKEVFSYFD